MDTFLLPRQPADPTPPPPRSAARPRTSDVTRLLSAGAETDPVFARRVITELLDRRHRFAAPSYGYDAVTVLGHALAARQRRISKNAAVTVLITQWVLFGVLGPAFGQVGAEAFPITLVICLWGIWAANLVDQVLLRQTLIRFLKKPRGNRGFHGVTPTDPRLTAELSRGIRQEQDPAAGTVFYSGYEPFVGAGRRMRTWSFAVLLERSDDRDGPKALLDAIARGGDGSPDQGGRPDQAGGTARGAEPGPDPFTAKELTAYVEQRLTERLLADDLAEDQRLSGLEVTRCLYALGLGVQRPDPAERTRAHDSQGGRNADSYDSAREYLCVRVGSWSQELVTSVFLNVDLKGRMLYTQLHGYVLMPIKADYHEVDQLPDRVDPSDLWSMAWASLLGLLVDMLTAAVAVFTLPFHIPALLRRLTGKSEDEERVDHTGGLVDWGARISLREMAASNRYHHFFQEADAAKYLKIVERRTLEVILDFLEEHHVDTTEYRDRQAALLNVGIMQTGGGTIVNRGPVAVGPQARAATGTGTG